MQMRLNAIFDENDRRSSFCNDFLKNINLHYQTRNVKIADIV